jgi:hypothetical protein
MVAPNGLDHQLRGLLLLPGCSVEEGQLRQVRQVGTWSDRAPEAANPWRNGKRKRVWYNCWKIWGYIYILKKHVCLFAIYLCVYAFMYIYICIYNNIQSCMYVDLYGILYIHAYIYIYIYIIRSFIYHIISPTKTALFRTSGPAFHQLTVTICGYGAMRSAGHTHCTGTSDGWSLLGHYKLLVYQRVGHYKPPEKLGCTLR